MSLLTGPFDLRIALAALLAGFVVARLTYALARPPERLAGRVRPYTIASRTALGQRPDLPSSYDAGAVLSGGTLVQLLGPPLLRFANLFSGILVRRGDEELLLRLRQAGLLRDVPEERRVVQWRAQALTYTAIATAAGLAIGFAVWRSTGWMLAFGLLGLAHGLARPRGQLDRVIRLRREQMRIELYTINHLLAMHARVGGGVTQAIQSIVERGSGSIVEELAEVLRLHRSGTRISEALNRAARQTPEPNAARTYKLLATGAEHGADLARALMDLSRDLQSQRREDLRRMATRQRAAMLIPIVLILAPIVLLFVAAPIPSMVFGNLLGR